jgi:regulator of ribosome biosynthesis
VELDLGNLLAFDPSAPATRDEAEAKAQATALTQALMNALLQLPSEATPVGRVAALPPPSTPLPRAKPLPKPREPTKWEKFAQQKGIVKRKRSALVFDENEQGFKRRYGYQRANEGPPVLEAKAGDEVGLIAAYHCYCALLSIGFDGLASGGVNTHVGCRHLHTSRMRCTELSPACAVQVGADPFTEEKAQKRERVKRNKASQLANLTGARGGAPAGIPASVQLAGSLPEHGRGRPTKRKDMQPMVRRCPTVGQE